MICTLYAHQTGFDKIRDILTTGFPQAQIATGKEGDSDWIQLNLPGGFLRKESSLLIRYRQRTDTANPIGPQESEDIANNIRGLYGYVAQLPCDNEKVHALFLQKITTLNCEFSVEQVAGKTKDLVPLIGHLAEDFDAVLFVQPGTPISRSDTQHFLDKNLELLLDQEGRCHVKTLDVRVNVEDFDHTAIVLLPEQEERKARSEAVLAARNIQINRHLPCVESAAETILRTPAEIAQRATALAVISLVANSVLTGEEATSYLHDYQLWQYVTPGEKDFLANPTPERQRKESWKSECIYTLLWAVGKIEVLAFPDEQCNMNNIPPEDYPIDPDKDPQQYIAAVTTSRSKEEILDAADLYYRLDWACVDARINNQTVAGLDAGVVYERHYALNWLIRYSDQEWDDVSCDT
ncbi:DUF4272 domain-containing protein [Paraflavitalea pollutisoli]|uniref:DUF4272 domain-containing protein n=1 Tax=Paraflavitalea pollutisoli TaxID=3034143 RepID=UPI0023EC8EEB|nr:DUF4272 domain-containing protein [Paraflavitalea sp. H1-2-19X]